MTPDALDNAIVYLFGFPGVAKYTVAREIAAGAGARVVDNHYVNNPIFGLLDLDGLTPLSTTTLSAAATAERVLAHVASLS